MHKRNRKGFSLLEVVFTVGLLGVTAAGMMSTMLPAIEPELPVAYEQQDRRRGERLAQGCQAERRRHRDRGGTGALTRCRLASQKNGLIPNNRARSAVRAARLRSRQFW